MNFTFYYLMLMIIVIAYATGLKYYEFVRPLSFILCIMLILFQLFKSPNVDDGSGYIRVFDAVDHFTDFMMFNKEPAYSVIPVALKQLSIYNQYTVFGTFAIIGVSFKVRFFNKYSPLPLLALMLYFPYFYLKIDNSGIRSGCAIAIYMWAVQDIYARNIKTYILKVLLASMFHVSILAAIPFYLFKATKVNHKYYLYFFLLVMVFDVLNLNPIKLVLPNLDSIDRLTTYTSGVESGGELFNPLSKTYLFWVFEVWFFLKNKDIILRFNKYSVLIVKIFYAGIIYLYLISPISSTFASRLSELFLIFNCIVVGFYYYFIKDNVLKLLSYSVFLIIYCFWTLQVSLSYNWLVDRHYYS